MMLSWHQAFSLDLNITLSKAGDLINQVDVSKLDEVENLTIVGDLNGTDILVIRKMVKLKSLNMENANIVNGGSSYYEDYITSENAIGAYFFKGNSELVKIVLPKSLRLIDEHALDGSEKLETVDMFDGVGSIGKYAFANCCRLQQISLSNTLSFIFEYAFSGCCSLQSIHLPTSLNRIYDFAFENCSTLTSLHIPNSVVLIGFKALKGCSSIRELYFEDGGKRLALGSEYLNSNNIKDAENFFEDCPLEIVYLGRNLGEKTDAFKRDWDMYSAFSNQQKLKDVYIGQNVKYLCGRNFRWCDNIENVHIKDLSAWCKIDFAGNTLGYAQHLLLNDVEIVDLIIPDDISEIKRYSFTGGFSFKSITTHNEITSIGESAFLDGKAIQSIKLAESITTIGEKAFNGCGNLERIISLNTTPPVITETTFDEETEKKATLTVSNGCKNIYWLHPYWENFTNIVEMESHDDIVDKKEDAMEAWQNANSLYQSFLFYYDGGGMEFYNQVLNEQAYNDKMAADILSDIDVLHKRIVDSSLSEEDKAAFNKQLVEIEDIVYRLRKENDGFNYTLSTFIETVQNQSDAMNSYYERLTQYKVRIDAAATKGELDAVMVKMNQDRADTEENFVKTVVESYREVILAEGQIYQIGLKLATYKQQFKEISEEVERQITSGIKTVIMSDGDVIVVNLRGERMTMKSAQIMTLPKGIYIVNGRKINIK